MDFAEIVANTERNNLIVRSVLREIDADTLVSALLGVDQAVRDAFLRNVSRRTRAATEAELKRRAGTTARVRTEAAQDHLRQLVRTFDERTPSELPEGASRAPPAIRVETQRQIVESFRLLAEYVQEQGIVSLDALEATVADPFMRLGLGLVVDGWDAIDWRSVMQKRKEASLQALDARLSMIMDGLESLQSGDAPRVVEEKLAAYLPPA